MLTPDVLAIALSFLARLDGLINVCVFAYLIKETGRETENSYSSIFHNKSTSVKNSINQ